MSEEQPRAYTKEELTDHMMESIWILIRYWKNLEVEEDRKIEGVVHSVLTLLDGMSGASQCAFDLVAAPHPDDEEFNKEQGENWVKPGTRLNHVLLNDIFYDYKP